MKIRNAKYESLTPNPSPRGRGGQVLRQRVRAVWDLVIGICLVIVSWLLVISLPVTALSVTSDISKVGRGARALSMGGVGVGLADDGNASFLNPAGLGFIRSLKVTSMYTNLLNEVAYSQGAVIIPTDFGVFGASYLLVNSGDSYVTTREAGKIVEASAPPMTQNSSLLVLSYGKSLAGLLKAALGANVKIYSQKLEGGNLSDTRGLGYDADLGILYQPSNWYAVGLTYQNLSSTPVKWTSGAEDTILSSVKLGNAVKILGKDGLRNVGGAELKLGLDLEQGLEINQPLLFHTGLEWRPLDFISIRGGLDQRLSSVDGSSQVSTNPTLGLGLKLDGFSFDYAYHQFDNLAEASTHYFSISYSAPEEILTRAQEIDGIITLAPREKKSVAATEAKTKKKTKKKQASLLDYYSK